MTMTMKKFFGMMTAMVMTAMSFTSCYDEDVDTSITLSGDWQGDFGMYYDYTDRYGKIYTCSSYDTDISFYPDYDYATRGYGYQVDHYGRGCPFKEVYHSFNWEIQNGRIYLYYNRESELNAVIRDYRMTGSHFTGYFGDSDEMFDLIKYADYYYWDPYWDDFGRDGWGYYYYDNWYYAATRANESDETAPVEVKPCVQDPEGGIIRMGNRFTEKK